MNNQPIHLRPPEIQARFLDGLIRISATGKELEWAQSANDPGFVYCATEEDLIVFEIRGANAEPVPPSGKPAGIVAKCRNVSYMWLENSEGWDALLQLLQAVPIDEARFIGIRQTAFVYPLQAVNRLDPRLK